GAAAMILDAVYGRAVHARPRLALAEDRQTDIRPKPQCLVRQNGDVAAVRLAVLRIVDIPVPRIRAGGLEIAYDNESADPLCSLCRIGIVLVKPPRSAPIGGALQPNDPAAKLTTAVADCQGGIFIRRQPDSLWVRREGRSRHCGKHQNSYRQCGTNVAAQRSAYQHTPASLRAGAHPFNSRAFPPIPSAS